MKENSQSLLLIYAFGQKASCSQSEFPPYMLKHHIAVVSRGLQREDMSVDETEIAQETSQLRPHPHGPYPSVVVFENEEPPCLVGVETSGFDDSDNRLIGTIAVNITYTQLIDWEWKSPFIGRVPIGE